MKYQPVIGLETHVELKTESKMFCRCSADYFGQKPNTHTCLVCLGLPGALPVPNKKAIDWCAMIGLALNCEIPLFSKFDRKNYFYPDLPKGYQISQYDEPFGIDGYVDLSASRVSQVASRDSEERKAKSEKRIRIRRVHMEEDTGKLIHELADQRSKIKDQRSSFIDFNRSGVPLVEIDTEPDFDNAADVKEYLQKLQQIVRYLGVSNADMEKGEMRLEPNISLARRDSHVASRNHDKRIANSELPSYKVEIKNINSFRFVEKAINYEIERQAELLEKGETPVQETRGWDERSGKTVSQRTKEEAHDYRYFPEPDIPPIRFAQYQISKIKDQIGELPDQKLKRFQTEYKLTPYDAEILTRELALADYFEEAVRTGKAHNVAPKQIANYIINKKLNIKETAPSELVELILTTAQVISVGSEELRKAIEQVILENPKAVEDYKSGKTQAIGFLIGKVKSLLPPKSSTDKIKEQIEQALK